MSDFAAEIARAQPKPGTIRHRDPDLCGTRCSKCLKPLCCLCDTGPFMCSPCQWAFDNQNDESAPIRRAKR